MFEQSVRYVAQPAVVPTQELRDDVHALRPAGLLALTPRRVRA
jgi:hypothetical protein